MKTWVLVMLLSSVAFASCPKGYTQYEGVCAGEAQPVDSGMFLADTVKPSDEKPPRNVQPPWETGEIHADTPPSQIADDEKQDAEKTEALAEGKKAAGIK